MLPGLDSSPVLELNGSMEPITKEPIEVNGHWEEVSATSLKVSTPDQISIGALTDFCMIQRGHPR